MLSRSFTTKLELLEGGALCRGILQICFFFYNRPSVHDTAAITQMPTNHCCEGVQGNGYL